MSPPPTTWFWAGSPLNNAVKSMFALLPSLRIKVAMSAASSLIGPPASASTSSTRLLDCSEYWPGLLTWPITDTFWLRYSITSTDTCGCLR